MKEATDLQEIIGDYETFIRNVSAGLKRCGIAREELAMMDHIAYRVETIERYEAMKAALAQCAFLLDESDVAGRLIATFELAQPLEVDGWYVPYLELPQPKEGSPYPEGLEHAELVVVGGLARFRSLHSDLPFDDKAMGKTINPELGLKHDSISVKFHETQLGAVCGIEQRLGRAI